jgi:hypothetical protein
MDLDGSRSIRQRPDNNTHVSFRFSDRPEARRQLPCSFSAGATGNRNLDDATSVSRSKALIVADSIFAVLRRSREFDGILELEESHLRAKQVDESYLKADSSHR